MATGVFFSAWRARELGPPPARVYDAHGVYQRDIGGPGQGPGEFQRPASIAIGTNGQIFLRDDAGRRILVYSQDGDYLHAYPMTGGMNTSRPMALSRDDVPYTTVFVGLRTDDPYRVFDIAMQAHGSDGPYGDLIMQPVADSFVPSVISSDDGSVQRPVPFSPREVWAVTADLDVIFGVSRSYRFEVRRRDGSLLEVERSAALVAVDPDEAAWHRANATAIMRDIIPDWIWNGPEVADTKPPFREFIPTGTGEIWVRRPGPGTPLPGCNQAAESSTQFSGDPCWTEQNVVDVFGNDGRYLGAVDAPAEMQFSPRPAIDGDNVVARTEDEAGTIMVKRYRLVLPGKGER